MCVSVCSATKQQIQSLIGMSKADLGHVVSQISNPSFPLDPSLKKQLLTGCQCTWNWAPHVNYMGNKLICKLLSFWCPAEIGVHKELGKALLQTLAYVDLWARVKFLLWPVPGSDYVTGAALELPDLTGGTELFSEDHFLKIAYTQRGSQGELGRLGYGTVPARVKKESGIIVNFLGVNQN